VVWGAQYPFVVLGKSHQGHQDKIQNAKIKFPSVERSAPGGKMTIKNSKLTNSKYIKYFRKYKIYLF
jgi:hypothetical protein